MRRSSMDRDAVSWRLPFGLQLDDPDAQAEPGHWMSKISDTLQQLRDEAEARQAAVDELKALAGDPETLEPEDLDASDAFTLTESATGTVVVTTPLGSRETGIAYSDETDSFADLADLASRASEELSDRLAERWAGLDLAAEPTDALVFTTATIRERLLEMRGRTGTEEPTVPAVIEAIAEEAAASFGPIAADFTGAGQTVVIIDDGYSLAYDQSATVYEYDFSGWRSDPSAETSGLDSHGSWVAQSVLDEASGVEIVHFKVFSDTGDSASLRDIEQALDAVIALAETTQVAAVNLSIGYGNVTEETTSALSDEFAELDALGVFSIAATGNEGQTYDDGVSVLAADPNVIGVSAVDDAGAFADFSQTHESLTDIAADGVDVGVETVSGQTFEVSGTSFAAPEVAGIAARLQEASLATIGETLTDEEFLEILQASGDAVEDASDADGYRVADGDAAVEYFLANAEDYGDLLIA